MRGKCNCVKRLEILEKQIGVSGIRSHSRPGPARLFDPVNSALAYGDLAVVPVRVSLIVRLMQIMGHD
jgi:hypothetical protein